LIISGGGGGVSALRVLDRDGLEIGAYLNPDLVSLQVGVELVLTSLHLERREFMTQTPIYYYPEAGCQGSRLMFADLRRYGAVFGTTLYFPTGVPVRREIRSYHDGESCNDAMWTSSFAPVATASVSQFIAPFSLGR